jgi:chromosome segregation ATPase
MYTTEEYEQQIHKLNDECARLYERTDELDALNQQLLSEQQQCDAYNAELREQIADLQAQLAAQPLTLTKLDALLDEYRKAKMEATRQVAAVAYAENDEALYKAQIILNAYQEGVIDGKNQGQRDMQETLALESNTDYITKRQNAIEARFELAQWNAQVDYLYQRISLYKAFLYSQSGVER